MRLDVRVVGSEQLLCASDRERLRDIHELTAAVVPPAGISLGVLIGEHRAGGLEHGLADEVLRRDELETGVLAMYFVADRQRDIRIRIFEGTPARRGLCPGGHAYCPIAGVRCHRSDRPA